MTDAAFASIDNARQMLGELDEVTAGWHDRVASRRDSAVWPLTQLLVSQPAVNLRVVMERIGVSKQAASTAINVLEGAGVHVKAKGEERNRAWVAIEIVEALDRFAARAGRRDRHWPPPDDRTSADQPSAPSSMSKANGSSARPCSG